jgi:hypothetical protein
MNARQRRPGVRRSQRKLAGLACCLALSCDPSRDDPPPKRQPCPPLTHASESNAPAPSAARDGVTKGAPPQVAVGSWIPGGKCNLEYLDGVKLEADAVPLRSGVRATISGWALEPAGKVAPDQVFVRFSSPAAGEYYGAASRRLVRDDVNATLGLGANAVQSGFELAFEADQLPEGAYRLTTVMLLAGKTYVCDNGRAVNRVRQ